MKTRVVLPRPGRCGWVTPFPGSPLPPGLDDRSPVFIVSVNGAEVRARDATGKVWQLARRHVDCGVYFVTPAGGWVHESKPRARNAIRQQLRHHLSTPRPEGAAGKPWDEKASYLLWILQRNGKGVGGAMVPEPNGKS